MHLAETKLCIMSKFEILREGGATPSPQSEPLAAPPCLAGATAQIAERAWRLGSD
jgi:hypothetical protein